MGLIGLAALTWALWAGLACSAKDDACPPAPSACRNDRDCRCGYVCLRTADDADGACVPPGTGPDAGAPQPLDVRWGPEASNPPPDAARTDTPHKPDAAGRPPGPDLEDVADDLPPDVAPDGPDVPDAADVPAGPDAPDMPDVPAGLCAGPAPACTPCNFAAGRGFAGACDGQGRCAPFFYALPELPAGLSWACADAPPADPPVPAGCGAAELPCNPRGPTFRWPRDTGQTGCYDEAAAAPCPATAGGPDCAATPFCGQDAQYGADMDEPTWALGRFVESDPAGRGEWVVRDGVTGLVWQRTPCAAPLADGSCSDAAGTHCPPGTGDLPWAEAHAYCRCLRTAGFAGYDDWRLPDRYELQSLVSYGRTAPASDFPDMPSQFFWSSTSVGLADRQAWVVHFEFGHVENADHGFGNAVRCVSSGAGGAGTAASRFYVAALRPGEPVVFDTRTGRAWQQTSQSELSWSQALAHCERLTYGRRSDWRLPDVLELASLVDATREFLTIDPLAFPNTGWTWYWSSSSSVWDAATGWDVLFTIGKVRPDRKAPGDSARCVTSGPWPVPRRPPGAAP